MTTFTTNTSKRMVAGLAAVLATALMGFEAMPASAAPPPHAPAWGYRRKQEAATNNYRNRTNRTRHHSPTGNDIDGDGIWNRGDRDMDGDGIPNDRDRDEDGDGINNNRDRYPTAPAHWYQGTGGRWQRRPQGWRAPASYYRQGSVVTPRRNAKAVFTRPTYTRLPRRVNPVNHRVNRRVGHRVGDADRDGIRNKRDRDVDGDGVRNRRDHDRDGDHVRNRRDRFDKNPRRR